MAKRRIPPRRRHLSRGPAATADDTAVSLRSVSPATALALTSGTEIETEERAGVIERVLDFSRVLIRERCARWGLRLFAQVDEDGVIDPITRFTRSSGRFRQRRGCFLRLSDPTGEPVYGLLLVLEGATHREPATLSEVPAAEIALVARILAKVSIASAHPS